METNNLFSFQRFLLLCKQSLIVNKKMICIALIGFSGSLFIALVLFQSVSNNINNWNIDSYTILFFVIFFSLGIIYTSLSFPAFRSKEKSMAYLMQPSGSSEKFVFELVTRLVVFILVMPLLFWAVANLEGALMHYFKPDFEHYQFSLTEGYNKITKQGETDGWLQFAFVQGGLFVFIFSFAGASHFTKSPLLKTLFTFSILFAGYSLLIYLMYKGLDLRNHTNNERILFMSSDDVAIISAAIAITVINLTLLAVAFFMLKEKEV